ncbi:complement decay-accelerating factor isoform X6 [Onychomys torridus]|uniref:complement decay-accelerating factor isoform X6 n=1 Tax=Onychomys torridus TaxID=38674 RepID=UPI00167F5982|nr:complement decay-accelerating factor isoform X6 [Onychomys torridus]
MGRARAPGTRSPPPPLLRQLLLLSSLLLLSPTVRGDCGQPPEIPNATPEVDGKTSFPKQSTVVYLCNKGFHKVPGKEDTAMCLENGQWSTLETFCNKSCDAPTRVFFAHPKKEYNNLNYFPIGTTVEYECRPGFRRLPLLSGISTCLESLEWSKLAEICKKKSCSNPGEIKNGHINIITNILFGSEIRFSCDTGYRLVGSTSSFCSLSGNTVEWSDPFPVCTEIFCSDPPEIKNGHIQEESDTYTYRHAVIYVCAKGFVLVGKKSIYCTVEDDQGKWSDPAPQCIEKSMIPSTSPKPTTVNVSVTQRVPATKTTTHRPPGTSKEKERSTSGGNRLIYGKFYSQGVKRNCHHCGKHNRCLWKRILSFNCLWKTVKIQCLWKPKGRSENKFCHVLWTPLDTQYVPLYPQQCSCSAEVVGRLLIIWPISGVALSAHCVSMFSRDRRQSFRTVSIRHYN